MFALSQRLLVLVWADNCIHIYFGAKRSTYIFDGIMFHDWDAIWKVYRGAYIVGHQELALGCVKC